MTPPKSLNLLRFWIITLLLLLLPAAILYGVAGGLYQRVPFWDDWGLMERYVAAVAGTLDHSELFFPLNNGHPILLPQSLLFAGIHFLGGDLIVPIIVSYLATMFIGISCCILGGDLWEPNTGARHANRWTQAFLTSLLLFSPTLAALWQWPLIVGSILPIAWLCAGLLTLRFVRAPVLAAILTIIFAELAFLSHGSGVTVPPLLMAAAIGENWGRLRTRQAAWQISGAALAFVLTITIYLMFLQGGEDEVIGGEITVASASVGTRFLYLLVLLGSPIAHSTFADPVQLAILFGGLILTIFSAVTGFLVRSWIRAPQTLRQYSPFLVLAGFALVNCGIIAMMRGDLGLHHALSDRYIATSQWVAVALVFLLPTVSTTMVRRIPLRTAGWVAAGVIVTLLVINWSYGFNYMRVMHSNRLQGEAHLNFLKLTLSDGLQQIMLLPEESQHTALKLVEQGKLKRVRMFEDWKLKNYRLRSELTANQGSFSLYHAETEDGRDIFAQGHALIDSQRRPADLIVFTWTPPGGSPADAMIFDLGSVWTDRNFFTGHRYGDRSNFGRWTHSLDLSRLPTDFHGPLLIQAWAINHDERAAHLLPGSYQFENGRFLPVSD